MISSNEIESYLNRFDGLDYHSLGLKDYPLSYFSHIHSSLEYYTAIYKQIINLAVQAAQKPISELTLVDYGSGNGFLGMFAKHCGFKKVWLCDISSEFLEASKITAKAQGIEIEDFILGEIDVVCNYFDTLGIKPDLLLSTDVIEHIYDLNKFVKYLNHLNPLLIHVFTTASNPYNFFKIRKLHKIQYKDEWLGYKELSNLELKSKGFNYLSFYEQRKEIIQKQFPHIPDKLIADLAKGTRGKRKQDILVSVHNFLKTGRMPTPVKDSYWVCDPETGSWTERILPINFYKRLYKRNGFTFSMFNGFYNGYSKRGIKKLAVNIINNFICMNIAGSGKILAPFIVFLGMPVRKSGKRY
jgi:hypothetical protein